ncbi:MAG: BspA family leucine-rich repeat surface protein [Allomuricauda sp.]
MKIRNVIMSLMAIALIWACGKDEDPAPPKNNAPVIAAKTFSVPENIAAGTAIGTVTATDADKDALSFSIKTNDNNLFAITKAGVLSLASGKSLDFATKAQHVITVAVSDGEASASAKVTINVTKVDPTNNPPVMGAQQFTVSESIDDTFEIGVVQATDPDQDDLVFSIVTNDNDLFEITEAGSLSLAAGQSLDFGTAQEHTITVAVSDGNSTVNAEITIKVTQGDPNNQSPVIEPHEFSVAESISDGYEIGIVEATDPEQDDMTFSISVNDNDLFEISVDGELSLAEGKQLDFDAAQEHVITVAVTDGNTVSKAEVTITVTEDPAPTGLPQEFGVLENIPDTEAIGTVVAEDPEGQPVNFSIVTNDNDLFEITITAGKLSLAPGKSLDYETATVHHIVVGVTDGFNTTNIEVTINVGDVDDTSLANDPASFVTTWQTTMANENITIFTNENYSYNYVIDWGDGTVEALTQQNPTHVYESPGMHTVAIKGDFPAIKMNNLFSAFALKTVEQWGTNAWKSMEYAFAGCQNLIINTTEVPNLSNVASMEGTFKNCYNFNSDISNWDVSNVTNMNFLFERAESFNQDITGWDVSNVTTMVGTFIMAHDFVKDINLWDVSNVTDMSYMFFNNQGGGYEFPNWNVGKVTNMTGMFQNSQMNPAINNWDVSNVTNMSNMFNGAIFFNKNLSSWKVNNVTNMENMFKDAPVFDQSLAAWNIGNVTDITGMLDNCGMSPANLNTTLISWSTPTQGYDPPINIAIGIDGLEICGQEAIDAAIKLAQVYGWDFLGSFAVTPNCN